MAIETALGGNIQNIVTDTETTAKDTIEYLKKNRYGRATFLPLSSMSNKTNFNAPDALEEKGVVGLASDLVEIKKEYEGVAKYLLGRVMVVDTIDNAISIERKYRYTVRIVTLEGEYLNVGGSISGGAFKNNSNLLGRRREIEEIEKSLTKLKKEKEEKVNRSMQLVENITNFYPDSVDKEYPNMACGSWIATENGIFSSETSKARELDMSPPDHADTSSKKHRDRRGTDHGGF